MHITSERQMRDCTRNILELGASKVVLKGGHMEGASATDILYDGNRFESIQAPRIDTPNTHGTGCTFSSAIAAHLALGFSFFDAVARAKDYISGAIANSLNIGKGHGPTHHFFDLYARAGLTESG
jgi:hydroxymethylpyrimidine/phosphomethylpyrimidine kinase